MKIEAGKLYAVITGDIVDSSKLPPEKRQQLHKVKQDRIALLWDKPIKQQSVVDNLNGADWKSIEKAISFFEKSLPKQSNS